MASREEASVIVESDLEEGRDSADALVSLHKYGVILPNWKGAHPWTHDIAALAEALKYNTIVKTLDLGYNDLWNEDIVAVAKALKINSSLEKLDLTCNGLRPGAIDALAEALKSNKSLKTLILAGNDLGPGNIAVLSEALRVNTTLTTLDLMGNLLEASDIEKLADALKVNTQLKTLNLSENRIGSRGILQLAEALKHNKTLTDLKLKDSEDSISSFEVILLADAVRANTTLTTLEISDNCFGVKDLVPLPDKLRSGASLAKLKLHEENLDELWSDDVVALTKALKISTGLTELNVEGMSIGSRGVVSVVKAATSHSSLTKLNVAGNKIEPKGIIALVNILKADTTLKFLNVADNELGLAGAEAMANMLETNTTLNSLSVRGCKLGREEIIPIVQALEKNTGLIELDLAAQRHIGATGVAALTKALMKNARLNSLDVTGLHIYPFEIALLAGALRNGIPNPTDTLLTVAKGKKYQKGDELPSLTSYWHNGFNRDDDPVSLSSLRMRMRYFQRHTWSYHDDADLLFESLMINESLTSLHFSRKSIHLENIRPLTKALEKKSALTVLDLSGNRIESDGVAALAALLPEAEGGPPSAAQLFQDRGQPPRGLRRLALAKALITSTAIRPLANALEKNSSLTALDLAGNFILSDGGILFAKVLKVNRSLTRLDLGEIHRSECVPELVEALRVNTTMTELKFTANGQDQDQIDFLKEKMEENKKLRWNILPLILLPTNLLRLEWLPCHQRELKPRPKATLVEIPMDMREIIADFLHNFL